MNENNDYTGGNVRPYKATANLNTAIANPSINVNDTMDINIQNYKTYNPSVNAMPVNNINPQINSSNNNLYETNIKPNETVNKNIQNITNNNINNNVSNNNTNTIPSNSGHTSQNAVVNTNNVNMSQNNNPKTEPMPNTNPNNEFVKKTYVTKDNKPKKKTISFNMGPEFKIGLLIIVILLAFVFVLPILNDLIMGY